MGTRTPTSIWRRTRRRHGLGLGTAGAALAVFVAACGIDENGLLLGDAQAPADATVDGFVPDATSDALGADAADGADGADATDSGGAEASWGDADAGTLCPCSQPDLCCVYVSKGSIAKIVCATPCAGPGSGQHLSELTCTGDDCADGGVCCIWRDGNGINHSTCQAACTGNDVQMCDLDAAASACPTTDPCSTTNITDWDLTAPLATCGGQGVP